MPAKTSCPARLRVRSRWPVRGAAWRIGVPFRWLSRGG
nr:MAG TPA: hypothetical protein [Caudoviricetes sp.]